jgi:hypothetical protein
MNWDTYTWTYISSLDDGMQTWHRHEPSALVVRYLTMSNWCSTVLLVVGCATPVTSLISRKIGDTEDRYGVSLVGTYGERNLASLEGPCRDESLLI